MPLPFLLALVASRALAVDAPEPRIQAAFGLAPLDRGVSLWLHGDKTFLGFELDRFELTWNKELVPEPYREYANPQPPWQGVDHLTRRIRASLTVKRLLSSAEVAPFVYLRLYVGLTHDKWEYYYHHNWTAAGPELGVGILFSPLKRASVAVRQGWAWEENDKTRPGASYPYYSDDRTPTVIRLQPTRLLVLWHF